MAANTNNNLVPSLLQPLASIFPAPIKALRAPTTLDKKYQVGQLWIDMVANISYVLTSVVANVANWTSPAAGGAGAFNSLTTTGAVTVGNALTVTAGGAAITGATTVVGAFTQSGGVANIGADATTNAVNIGTGAAAKTVTVGTANGTSQLHLIGGSGGIILSAAGFVMMDPAVSTGASANVTLNTQVGRIIVTGLTTAAAGTQAFVITNSQVTISSGIFVSAYNVFNANAVQLTVQGVTVAAGSMTVTLKNNGAAALDGNVIITFWIIS